MDFGGSEIIDSMWRYVIVKTAMFVIDDDKKWSTPLIRNFSKRSIDFANQFLPLQDICRRMIVIRVGTQLQLPEIRM